MSADSQPPSGPSKGHDPAPAPGSDHAHAHAHDHGHGHGQAPNPGLGPVVAGGAGPVAGRTSASAPGPESAVAGPAVDSDEDAGAVALSEALRSSFVIVRVLLAGLVIYFLGSGIFTVTSQERAIILRFGKPVRHAGQIELDAGLHWAFPYPLDEVIKMPVAQLQTAMSSVGWYAVTPEQEAQGIVPDAGTSLNPAVEGYAITGDGNIIHTRALVRYRITEPLKFFLDHRDGASVLTNLIDSAVTYASARYGVDDALRRDVAGFKELVLRRVNELVTVHDLGVTIEPSDVVTLPPRQVKEDFDAVLSAEVDRSTAISGAQSYANRVINEARGRATAVVNTGETERNRLVQAVASEAQKFASLLPEYRKDPEFFRERLQIEALKRILTNAQDKFYLPLEGRDELRIQLNREPVKPVKQILP